VAALDAGDEAKWRWAAVDLSANRVWSGTKRLRRETRLGAWNEAPGTGEGGRRRAAARWRRRASIAVGKGEEWGKQAGKDPYPKTEL
jgi:hypothetical protein